MTETPSNSKTANKRILLAEDDDVFREAVARILKKEGFEVSVAVDGKTAQELAVMDTYAAVISDIRMPGKITGVDLFHFVKKRDKSTPVILMTGFSTLSETKEAHEIGIDGFLSKPFQPQELKDLLRKLCGLPSETTDRSSAEDTYRKLSIDDFVSGRQIQAAIFIRLGDDKYVKLGDQGEDLPLERIEGYKKKGIRHLYLRAEDFQRYIQFNLGLVDALKTNVQVSAQIPKEKKVRLLQHTSEVLLEEIYSKEMDQESFEDARIVVETSVSYLADFQEGFDLLSALNFHSDWLYAHCLGTSLYASLIAKAVGWQSAQTMYKVALGGLLHDIGKKELPKELLEKPRTALTPDEVKTLESHPTRGMELLSRVSSVSTDILQIVLEHHERDLGNGYPAGLTRSRIHPLARLISVANEFCHWAVKNPNFPALGPQAAISRIVTLYGNSMDPSYIEALKKVFHVRTSERNNRR